MPKVYKYIQLNDCEKIQHFEKTLLTNEIWLSKYNQLNDPMEGIYYTYSGKDAPRFLLSEKNKYLIGCFGSSPDNFSLWAYYADGFRGACIEIELDENIEPHKITYVTVEEFREVIDAENENLNHILTRKLSNWKLENEIRVLIKDNNYLSAPGKLNKIGKIKAVYFGINTGHKVVDWMEKL